MEKLEEKYDQFESLQARRAQDLTCFLAYLLLVIWLEFSVRLLVPILREFFVLLLVSYQ